MSSERKSKTLLRLPLNFLSARMIRSGAEPSRAFQPSALLKSTPLSRLRPLGPSVPLLAFAAVGRFALPDFADFAAGTDLLDADLEFPLPLAFAFAVTLCFLVTFGASSFSD